MKNGKYINLLPPVSLLLGLAAWQLHSWLYRTQVEDPVSGLLPFGTLPEILIWVLTGCVLLGAFLLTRHVRMGAEKPIIGALSDAFFAAGILTLLLEPTKGPAALVLVYRVFCVAAALSLAVGAVMQLLKRKPFFLLEVSPCVLCVLVMLEYYQFFSEVPQMMNYVLGLGAVLCLSLGSFHRMAQASGLKEKPYYFGIGLLAIYFCAAAGCQGIFVSFFCAAAVWMMAQMARLCPAEG